MGFLILCIRRINFDAKHGEWTWPNMGFGGRQDVNLKVKGALIIKYPNMVVSWNGGTPKSSILMVLSTFPYKPSIWGYLHFRKPPHTNWTNLNHQHMFLRFQEISTGAPEQNGADSCSCSLFRRNWWRDHCGRSPLWIKLSVSEKVTAKYYVYTMLVGGFKHGFYFPQYMG